MPKRAAAVSPYRELPIELIDPPERAMRETFDEDKLAALVSSVRHLGIRLPILVKPVGDRFEIQDGHRRYTAAIACGLATVPVLVQTDADAHGEAVKVHCNLWREDVNPAEEAVFLDQLLCDPCEGDTDKLCSFTGLKREYVENRLSLLYGDQEVLAAVRQNRLSFGVARELNKVADRGYRKMYLEAAAKGGASAGMVREWRLQAERAIQAQPPDSGDGTNQFSSAPAPITTLLCFLCESDEDPWELEFLYAHRRCRKLFLDRFLAQLKGQAPAPAEASNAEG